jgi:hypothetical protein
MRLSYCVLLCLNVFFLGFRLAAEKVIEFPALIISLQNVSLT